MIEDEFYDMTYFGTTVKNISKVVGDVFNYDNHFATTVQIFFFN